MNKTLSQYLVKEMLNFFQNYYQILGFDSISAINLALSRVDQMLDNAEKKMNGELTDDEQRELAGFEEGGADLL